MSDTTEEREDVMVLREEQYSIMLYMRYRSQLASPPSVCRKKNSEDSTSYRKIGNELYSSKIHDNSVHRKIWKLYTQCIALAPNGSAELALGYGNRSAFLLHIKEFEHCIKDIDRAIDITIDNHLKTKLLSRKAECLLSLKDPLSKSVCEQGLRLLPDLKLDKTMMSKYSEKFNSMLVSARNIREKPSKPKKNNYYNELINFPRCQEVPCASTSVAIEYNREWGRHVVATQNIKVGEIIAVDKNYHTHINDAGMYLFCSNCTKYALSSIPCDKCIYDVYCSESCQSEAWEKFHQWECAIYPYIWDIDKSINSCQCAMRLFFRAYHQAGSIDNLRKEIAAIENCKDPRTKGFSNGIYDHELARSVYSLMSNIDHADPFMKYTLAEQCCLDVYLLATHTKFFGEKLLMPPPKMFLNKDVLFVASLILHSHFIYQRNSDHIGDREGEENLLYKMVLRSFTSLVNHSCDPNVSAIFTNGDKTVITATKFIKKGSQLFNSYQERDFLYESKEERQLYLEHIYGFTCKCIACTENWSNICLPSITELAKNTPSVHVTMLRAFDKSNEFAKTATDAVTKRSFDVIRYKPKLFNEVKRYLQTVANKVTEYCEEYWQGQQFLEMLLYDIFGNPFFYLPNECYTAD